MENEGKNDQKKKTYEKPRVLPISLAAEEVMAAGCKANSTGGKSYPTCRVTMCAAIGT